MGERRQPRSLAVDTASLLIAVALLPSSLGAQAGIDRCSYSASQRAEAEFKALLGAPRTSWDLDSLLYEVTREQADFQPVKQVLSNASIEYGVQKVAKSLFTIAEGSYWGSSEDRGQAAIAYGLLHSLYPDSVPYLVLASMLTIPRYPDELKRGIVWATQYVDKDVPELSNALSAVLCQTALHVRPFVADDGDLARPTPAERQSWYDSAVRLLRAVVSALSVRSGGNTILIEHVANEPNKVLARWIEHVAAHPDTLPYF